MGAFGTASESNRRRQMVLRLGDVPRIEVSQLIERYELVLLDAFGVLVNNAGALPGARELIEALERAGKPYLVVTNDASKLAATSAARYQERGLPIPAERVVTSGSLIPRWFAAQGLSTARLRCVVLGPPESVEYVRAGGGEVIEADEGGTLDALIVADDMGYPLLGTLDAAISMVFHTIESGRRPWLVLPNPDLIYPKGGGRFGITAGSVALVIDHAIQLRYPELGLEFVRLGKPHAPIFEAAFELGGSRKAVILGDQLRTDVAGANAVGIDSVLMGTGVTAVSEALQLRDAVPTYWMRSLVEP